MSIFISLQQLEQRPFRFSVDVAPNEIEFDSRITQITPLHAEGAAEFLSRS